MRAAAQSSGSPDPPDRHPNCNWPWLLPSAFPWVRSERCSRRRSDPTGWVAADEPVKIIEAEPGRPEVERPRGAALPGRHVMVLAKPSCVVTVPAEYFGDGSGALWHQGIVAGVTEASFHDDPGMHGVL